MCAASLAFPSRLDSAGTSQALADTLLRSPVVDKASMILLDLRNNYGGVIQDALLDASLFIDDPEAILCYTVSTRFSPHPHTTLTPPSHHTPSPVLPYQSLPLKTLVPLLL